MKLTSIKTLLLLLILSFGATSYAQVNPVINFQSIPSGPYGKGSSIAVLFKPEGLVPIGSSFNLYLSDQNGSFSNGNVAIGSVNAFYTTYINGLIPSNTVAGSAYKLKVEIVNATGTVLFTQTIPNLTLTIQNNFGTNGDSNGDFLVPTDAGGDAATYKKDNTLKYFGFPACGATINSNIFLSNKTPLSISWTSKNEFDFTTLYATDPFVRTATLAANTTVEINQFLKKVHYRFFQQATDPGNANTISTKAFYFINNSFIAPYSALANSVCYEANQARTFSFEITTDSTISGSGSINAFFNFPQSVYTANWDDGGISNTYNIRSLINSSGVINHDYSKSSCGESVVTGVGAGGTIYNSFGPGIRVDHIATCNATAINNITTIQIFQKPKLDFTFPSPTACLNTAVTFTNTSDLGLQGTTTTPGCTAPNITFQWKVDGVNVATTTNFTISSLSVGTHTIVLSPVMANGVSLTCTPTSVAKTICIESIPPNTAKFALISNDNTNNSDTSFCPGNTAFNVINQSGTLTSNAFCNPLTYNWKLIGPSPFVTLTATASSASPNFQVPALTISGQYTLTLTISNPCGTSNAFTRIITVLIPPSITTQPVNRSICDGSATTFSAIAAGSNLTYQWQVSTDNGATFNNITNSGVYTDATTATLTLTGVTVSMTGYKYKLIVSGTCPPPAVSNIVTLTVNPRPTSVVTGSTTVCANTATQISIALTGTAPWSITYSDGTTPTTVTANTSPYTFNVTLGTTKTYTITVLSDANCTANTGDKTGSAVITVNPLPTITGTLTACVGATTQLTGSATADATTPWSSATPGVATISNTGLVTGISGGTSVITYKNTNGCLITSTVTIYALPTVTIPTATQSLCKTPATPSGTLLTPSTTIGTGSSSLTYQWFSNANNVNTGGSLVATSTTYTPSNANTGETYYYLTVTNNNSCAATSNVSGIIKVYSQPTISALTNASYCKDVTASALNPTFNNGGYGTLTYQWYSNNTNSTTNAVSIPNETNATYTPPTNVVGTKYYYVIAQNGGPSSGSNCNTLTSSFAEIKVYATPTIPTDPISATYCATQTPAALTVPNATAGGNGTISYKWYTNTTATNSGGTAISNETGPTYTPPITVANTYYYYVTIGNGATGGAAACSSNNSGVATIIVNPLPVITSSNFVAQELCKDGAANVMTAAATTATGTITGYQWYKNTSATNIGGTSIANATNATFTPTTSATGTFYYYCEITNSFGCTTKTPVSGIINVYAAPVITVQPIAANYCKSNSATATLLSVTANTDAPGVLTYQWFSNVNNANTGGVLIPSATSATYRPLITTASATYYYVEVSNGGPAACVKTASSAVLINVYSSPIISVSSISANYCKDANASALSITDNNGGVGSLTYQWYSNTSAINTGGTTIPTATNATYTPPTNVVGNFYYYVINNNGGPASTCNSTSSAVATISVYAAPSIVTHPVSATYCKDNTVTTLTVGGAATGGLGTLAYQWFSNTTNSNIGGTQIANATTNSYTPLSTTPGTYYYYVEVRNGATGGASSCNTTASNVATFIVNPLPVINSQTTAAQDVCLNVTANQMSVTATTATGTITNYQWYKNTTASNSGGTSISNETNATFIPPTNLVGTSYYYCIVTNSFGCTTKSAVSGLINTFGTPVINTQPTGASYCQNVAATALSISATPGGIGTINYQWYSNAINATTGGVLLTNETNTTYTPPTNLVGTTYYYVVVNNGGAGGCNSLASNTAAIIVKDLPTINAYSLGAQTLCLNSVPTNLSITASTASGTITGYQWYFNTTNSITNATLIPSATNASYTPLTNTANTKYYFAIITNSLNCTTQSLISGNIIVNALPSITAQPSISAQSTCLNGSFTNLSVAASTGSGSISKYEWYSNTSNSTSGGTLVATHTISTSTDNYTPLATAVGTLYYYVIVYNTNGCTTTSNASAPIVVNDLPSFVVQPANTNQAVCLNTATTNLSVTASAGSGTIATYTWYQSATNAAIGNSAWTVAATHTSTATTDTYTPPNNTIGTMYYYVVVTNSNGCVKSSTASGSVTINPVPSITNQTTATCSGIAFGITLTNGGSLVIPNGTTYSWNAPTVTGGITGGTTGTAQTTLNGLLVNPTNTAQTATYTITPKTGNCDGATFTLIVTVNPKPTVNNKTIDACSGSNFALNFTHGTNGDIIPSNTTYSWAIPSVTGSMTGGASANNQTGLNGNITNVTNTQKIATYTLTPTAPLGSCGGDNFTVIVNINAKPSIPNKTATICSADAFTISPSNNGTEIVPSGTTYTWTVINNTSITGETDVNTASNNISQTLTNTSNTTQLVNYTVTPVSGDIGLCTGSTFPIVVTVNARPSISTKTVIACSNEAFTATITNAVNNDIVPSGTTYSWSIPIVTGNMTGGAAGTNALSVTGNLLNPTSVSQTATYTVTPTTPGTSCSGPSFTVTVTIKPKAIITAKSVTPCSTDAFTFILTDGANSDVIPAGSTYTWLAPTVTGGITGGAAGSAQSTISGTLTNPSNTTQTATYSITANSNGCTSTAFSATATVYAKPVITTQNVSTCSGTAFSVPLSNGGGIILPASTTFTWTVAQNNNVTGAINVTSSTSAIAQNLTNLTNTDQLVVYTVTPISGTTGACAGNPFTVNVTVKPKPSIAPQSEIICSGISFNNAPSNGNGSIVPSGITYTWSTPVSSPVSAVNGGTIQNTAQSSVSQNLNNTTNAPATLTYAVTPTAAGCAGSSYTLVVTVNPKPNITQSQSKTICSSETFTVTPVNATDGIVPTGTTYTWTVVDNPNVTGESTVTIGASSISQTLVNTSNTTQIVTYTVTPTSGDAGGCVGSTFTVTITVNPQPFVISQTQTICSGLSFGITPLQGGGNIVPANTKYTWSNPLSNPLGAISGGGAQAVSVTSIGQLLNNTTNTSATINYSVIPISSNNCSGPAFSVVVTVNPKPYIITQAQTICSENTFTVSPTDGGGSIVPTNTTYTWPSPVSNPLGAVSGGLSQISQASNISQLLTNTTNAAATLTYQITPKSGAAGSCDGAPFQLVVTVNAKPVVGPQTQTVCSGTLFNLLLTNSGSTIIPANTTYTWYVSTNNANISGQTNAVSGQSSIIQTLTNNSNTVQQIIYTVTPKSGATGECTGSPFTLTVTVYPKPYVVNQSQTICSESAFNISPVNGSGLIVPASTTYTWGVPVSLPVGAITGGTAQSNASSVISQTLTNISNSQATLTYTVIPKSGTTGGCTGNSFNVVVTVSPKPILTSTLSPTAKCNATNFIYDPISPTDGASWIWTRGIISGISNTSSTGTNGINETLINTTANPIDVPYSFALTTYGCPNTQTVTVRINPTPVLSSATSLTARCSGASVYYNPTSATVGTTYTWTRTSVAGISNPTVSGTGAISENLINTSANPITVTYNYTLTANGCTNPQTVTVTIDPLPISNFTIGGLRADCGPSIRTLINNSTVNGNALTNGTFTWGIEIIKNGSGVPLYNLINTNYTTPINYTFSNKGIIDSLYPIALTATSPNGCISTYRDTITIHPDAHLDVTVKTQAACAPFDAINATNIINITDPSPSPTINLFSSYTYTIRNRNNIVLSTTISPNPPNYQITNADDTLKIALKVNSLFGCKSDSVNKIVYTYQNPIVNFTVGNTTSCTMLSTQAVNTSYIGPNRNTSTLKYNWYANGSLISTIQNPLTFNLVNNSNIKDSVYTLKLVISETTNGCKDSSSVGNLVVYPKPKAVFTIDKANQVCTTISGVTSSINNTSLFKTGTTPQYKWSVTYNNLFDTAKAIIIDSVTTPYFGAKPNFKFKDAQGTVDTSYNVNMMIYTVNGCIDTLSKSIKINRRPKVDFTVPIEGCGVYIINPVDNTTNFPNDSLQRIWNILPSGGVSLYNSTANNPYLILPINNTANSIAYKIKQIATSLNGCIDSLNRFTTIHPKPTASFTAGKLDSCGPWTKTMVNTSDPKNGLATSAVTSRWEVRKDNIIKYNTATQNLTFTFTNTGVVDSVYTVRLFISNPQGCLDTTALTQITVHPNAKAYFNTDTLGCAPFKIRDHIKVQDFPMANDIWRYEWRIYDRFGFLLNNYDSSVLAPNYIIENESDTVTLQLIAYSKWGCTQDIFSRQVITRANSVHALVSGDTTICSNLPLSLLNGSYYGNNNQTSGLSYQWYVNDSKVSNLTNPIFNFSNNSNTADSVLYLKLLTTYTNTGCNDSTTKKITIYPAPKPNFSITSKEICGVPVGYTDFIYETVVAKN
ncbi:MAG: PKD-like domain-containing protein, partial [Sediminibacterium sp.]